jgi:hypothetical protein
MKQDTIDWAMMTIKKELIEMFEQAHREAYGHASCVDFTTMSVKQVNDMFQALINTNF